MEESSGGSSVVFTDGVGNKRHTPLDEEDRISALPDALIQHILSLLPTTVEAIRTGILSKRWLNQWTQVPVLIFEPLVSLSGDDYVRFIETTLILYDCPKIKKFHLELDAELDMDPQLTSKLRFASRRCVEELILLCDDSTGPYLLPNFLLDSDSLVSLQLAYCSLMPNVRVNLPSLKSLILEYCNDCSKEIENIVSGSPSLERIEIGAYSSHDGGVTIISESLKVLSFVDTIVSHKTSCPNLVEFSMVGGPISSQLLENVLSGNQFIRSMRLDSINGFGNLVISSEYLKVLHLDFEYDDTVIIEVSCPNLEELDFVYRGNIFKVVNLPSSVCANVRFYDSGSLKQLLEQFQHVNKLTIGGSFFQIVSDLDVEVRLSLPLLNSKYLTLNISTCNFGLALPGIAYALRSPTLETLVINLEIMRYKDTLDKDCQDYWNTIGSTGFPGLASHLKTVEITGLNEKHSKCKLVLKFIEFVLKDARALEKMTVSLEKSTTPFVIEVSQKLLSFPRRSSCCVILNHPSEEQV